MKQLKLETGGRPFVNDDLATLQQELTDAVQAQFLGKGPFILSGCFVSGPAAAATVSAGIVCLGGQLLRFAGQSGVALPAQFQAGGAVLSDQRPYQTGGTKSCMSEVPAVLVASNPAYSGGEFLPLNTWGGLRWEDLVRASVRSPGEVQQVASLAAADYVQGFVTDNGLGKPGTEAWGWALCNGNNGTADLRGMFVLGHNPERGNDGRGNNLTVTAIGNGGGAETHTLSIGEMPRHGHTSNANRVTDTVQYATGRTGGSPQPGAATVNEAGGGQAHNNMPPHYVLAMRQWVGFD